MPKETLIEHSRGAIPAGAYTVDTLPPMSEGAKKLEATTMRLAEKIYAGRQQAVAESTKGKLQLSDKPRTWLRLTDTPKRS